MGDPRNRQTRIRDTLTAILRAEAQYFVPPDRGMSRTYIDGEFNLDRIAEKIESEIKKMEAAQ